ncbi:Predicted Fe2+/Mn2+ transporter, VIT1/CCC1 family [Collimonas sp. OK242]|jgi:VIT1/CCC1 family predicted Fe2+/Mn2+ transporter|uniref:VIT1/CCC1 transporter family protein n=1 Tax=Collimonas sp. OK242 TaxID=1798195 RepID=UPI0008998CBA|nr:VIT family protein [Collimonas sp. OK242]SDX40111.1 Predicted Fe2+/Mn2+ transporter, VIT1/CCC1 family [Collimonas sp. OK242]
MTAHIHRTHRSGWLRASVLGANDGVLSISSLLLGVAAAHMNPEGILITGFAGLAAGALSMGAGEFVSVSSQADTERADLDIERRALLQDYDAEHIELRDIYIQRGLDLELASQVAQQLMEHDAIGAHARDDIGITEALTARPLQAAISSSLSFMVGGVVPMLAAVLAPAAGLIPTIAVVSLIFLGALGVFAARTGGAPVLRGAARVLILGLLAMGVTGVVGAFFGGAA